MVIAAARGFRAGVDRALLIVEPAIGKYGTPLYPRHEIVHDRYIVDMLREKGAAKPDRTFRDRLRTLGITAGGWAPGVPVRERVDRLAERFTARKVGTGRETVAFKLPRGLEVAA